MAATGLADRIYNAVIYIDAGRKGFAIRGKADEGRLFYEEGIENALIAFQEASNQGFATSLDSYSIIHTEYAFLTQEFQLCDMTIQTFHNMIK